MTADYNRTEAERLIAEAKEDHEIMAPVPWVSEGDELYSDTRDEGTIQLAGFTQDATDDCQLAIARTRNNLPDLADQLEAAGREVESQWSRNDEIRAAMAVTAAERDSLRQKLEAAQRTQAVHLAQLDGAQVNLTETKRDLAAAQKRIAELEADVAVERASKQFWTQETAAAQSVIGAIWPVYRAAVACELSDQENDRGEYVSHETAELNLSRAVDAARTALTPEILAALKAAGLENE